jgi:peptidoglycan DL-endopeptidase CwlO
LPSDDLLNSGSPSPIDGSPLKSASSDCALGRSADEPRTSGFSFGYFGPRRLRWRSALGVLMSAVLVGSAVLTTSSATAAPKPTISQVQKKIDRLGEEAEKASEQFNETREELKTINVRLKAAHADLTRQQAELAKVKVRLGQIASETYRRGEMSTLNLVLGDDPDTMLAQAGFRQSLGDRQAASMAKLKDGEKALAEAEATIQGQLDKAKAAKAKLQKTRSKVKEQLRKADAQLRTLTAAQQATLTSANQSVPAGAGTAFCNGKAVNAPSAAAKAAIAFACAQIGDPYVWAASGPNSWDCSGLTMKAFAAGGVSLPHSSRQQAGYGTSVSASAILPGDLVFFNSPISHVGIALGGGLMVHAPNSSTVVKVAEMYKSPSAVARIG